MEIRTKEEWYSIIESAIQSGENIVKWCREHGIEKSVFYRHCRTLGYIKDGRRTDKWDVCSADPRIVPEKNISPDTLEGPSLVPVPKLTICAAMQEIREDDIFPVRDTSQSPDMFPSVYIQKDAWKVFVGDGFRKETLRDVLEVITDAQGS